MGMFDQIGQALRLIRELRGLNQIQAAKRTGVSKSQLSVYERGKVVPELPQLARILDGLDVTLADLARILAALELSARSIGAAGPIDEVAEGGADGLVAWESDLLLGADMDLQYGRITRQLLNFLEAVRRERLHKALERWPPGDENG